MLSQVSRIWCAVLRVCLVMRDASNASHGAARCALLLAASRNQNKSVHNGDTCRAPSLALPLIETILLASETRLKPCRVECCFCRLCARGRFPLEIPLFFSVLVAVNNLTNPLTTALPEANLSCTPIATFSNTLGTRTIH